MLTSPFGRVSIPNLTLPELLLQNAERYSNKRALIDAATGHSLTYTQVAASVRQLSSALYHHGVRHGDVVLICSLNRVEYPLWTLAVASLGAVLTTTNPNYIVAEITAQLKLAKVKYLVTEQGHADKVKAAAQAYRGILKMFSFGEVAGCISHESLMSAKVPSAANKVVVKPDDPIFLPFSSGTTGSPKGVVLMHRNIVSNLHQAGHPNFNSSNFGQEVYLCVVPMYHIYGLSVLQMFTLFNGETLVVMPKFDLEPFLQAVQKYRVTVLNLVPPIIVLLSKHPLVSKYDTSSVGVIYSGAAPLGEELGKEVMNKLDVKSIKQGYGMTEASPVTHLSPAQGWKHGSVGLVVPNTECKVVDLETGRPLGPMQDGEICIRGPQVMKGYLNLPEATASTIDKEGWLHTGDIGHYDQDQHFYIVDRLKELIKFNGLQVAPADLEALLLTHPDIADCGVIGIPDPQAGELPRAYVVLKPGSKDISPIDIQLWVAKQVSPHKKLRGGVIFVAEIPKSPTGKILRRQLKVIACREAKAKAKL